MKYQILIITLFLPNSSNPMFFAALKALTHQKKSNIFFSVLQKKHFSRHFLASSPVKAMNFPFDESVIKESKKFSYKIYEGNTLLHTKYECLPIDEAVSDTQILQKLLDEGVNKECTKANKETLLHRACALENEKSVWLLLEHNVSKDPEDINRRTPLFWAVELDNYEIAQRLLDSGCNARSVDCNGIAPLDIAVKKNLVNIASLLLKHGAFVNRRFGIKNQTVLHVASHLNHSRLVTILGNNGAHINAQNSDGDTPLHLIVKKLLELENHPEYYKSLNNLLEFKPNIYLKNNENKDVLDLLKLEISHHRGLAKNLLYEWKKELQELHDKKEYN